MIVVEVLRVITEIVGTVVEAEMVNQDIKHLVIIIKDGERVENAVVVGKGIDAEVV